MGKGKQSEAESAREHVSRPLATLKDPALFGPPPKNVNYHGGAALPNEITPHREGLGAPLRLEQVHETNHAVTPPAEDEQPARSAPPSTTISRGSYWPENRQFTSSSCTPRGSASAWSSLTHPDSHHIKPAETSSTITIETEHDFTSGDRNSTTLQCGCHETGH